MAIKLLALDVDGVMSSGQIIYSDTGIEMKEFNTQDGLAIGILQAFGIKTAIITGRESSLVQRRGEELKFTHIIMNCRNKSAKIKELCQQEGISLEEVAFIGDDLNDLGALSIVGLPITPANGRPENKHIAKVVTKASGGHGAIREAIEYILKEEGKWDMVVEVFTSENYDQSNQ